MLEIVGALARVAGVRHGAAVSWLEDGKNGEGSGACTTT